MAVNYLTYNTVLNPGNIAYLNSLSATGIKYFDSDGVCSSVSETVGPGGFSITYDTTGNLTLQNPDGTVTNLCMGPSSLLPPGSKPGTATFGTYTEDSSGNITSWSSAIVLRDSNGAIYAAAFDPWGGDESQHYKILPNMGNYYFIDSSNNNAFTIIMTYWFTNWFGEVEGCNSSWNQVGPIVPLPKPNAA